MHRITDSRELKYEYLDAPLADAEVRHAYACLVAAIHKRLASEFVLRWDDLDTKTNTFYPNGSN